MTRGTTRRSTCGLASRVRLLRLHSRHASQGQGDREADRTATRKPNSHFSPPTMPPSAFKPPRATLRAEHRNRFGGSSLRLRGDGAHLLAHRVIAVKLLATYYVTAAAPSRASGPPMPVALRATTIVAAPPDCGILRAATYMNYRQPKLTCMRARAV